MISQPGAGDPATPRRRPATSVDVARLAGVSRATVSHVLNGQVERFAPETIERVRRAAAELGYVRSAAGRALAMGRSDFVVLAVPHTSVNDLRATIEAVSADLEELGFMSVVHFRVSEAERVVSTRLNHLVATLRPAGVVDLGGMSRRDFELVEGSGCPVLPSLTRPESNGNVLIGRMQGEHLCSRGFTRIAFAFPPGLRDDAYGYGRVSGVAEACAQAGLARPEVLEMPAGAPQALRRLLATPGARVGIATYDDEVAEAVVTVAGSSGVAVPEQLGVIGVRDDRTNRPFTPPLSAVRVDLGAALDYIRRSVVEAYGGPERVTDRPRLSGLFDVVQGATT